MPEIIRVFHVDPDAVSDAKTVERYLELLNDEERARYERFMFDHSKLEFLVGKALVRTVLGHELSIDPRDIEFGLEKQDKPVLKAGLGAGLEFNLSHTRNRVACVIGRVEALGVDVEVLEAERASEQIARRFFAEPEVDFLAKLPEGKRTEAFFRLWTLKEAFVKAKAEGLTLSLQKFYFQFDPETFADPSIGFVPGMAEDPARWRFHAESITPAHSLAVAACVDVGSEFEVEVREFRPLIDVL